MANWNELFYNTENCLKAPETEIYKFINLLKRNFNTSKLKVWDLGCGAGRHTVAMSLLGNTVYASDNSEKAISLTTEWLEKLNLCANIKKSEMNIFPFDNETFHGVISWDVLQHNTLEKIKETINIIWTHLVPGGMLLATIKSDKADLYGQGTEIEHNTFVLDTGKEAGVPHHYFNETELRELFDQNMWHIKVMAEQIVDNVEKPDEFWKYTPFRNTTWCVLMQKK